MRDGGLKNMQQLIQLRWIAVVGQVAHHRGRALRLGIRLPLHQMLAVLACLAAFNLLSLLRWRLARDVTNGELFVALLVDVAMLTAQLYLSGGAPTLRLSVPAAGDPGRGAAAAWSVWTMVAATTNRWSMRCAWPIRACIWKK